MIPSPTLKANTCGQDIVDIAREAIGRPYVFASVEWPAKSDPPLYGSCLGLKEGIEFYHATLKEQENLESAYGKCSVDCSTFVRWVYNRYAYITNQPSFLLKGLWSQAIAETDGRIVGDRDPMDRSNPPGNPNYNELQPGDILFFIGPAYDANHTDINHTFIYGGLNETGSPFGVNAKIPLVEEHVITGTEWVPRYVGAKRLCPDLQ